MPDDSTLDPKAIASLREIGAADGGQFFREVVEIFLNDTPARIGEIEKALAAADAPTLTRAAHSIKGSAGNFGAGKLAALARSIEALGKQGALGSVPMELPKLQAEFATVKAALEAELARKC